MRLVILFIISYNFIQAQNAASFDHMSEGSSLITYLYKCKTVTIDENIDNQLTQELKKSNLHPSKDTSTYIGNFVLTNLNGRVNKLFKSPDQSMSLYVEEYDNYAQLEARWLDMRKWKGIYAGYESYYSAFYYLKLDTSYTVSINATFKTKKHIVNLQKRLLFKCPDMDAISDNQWKEIDIANTQLLTIIKGLCNILVSPKEKIYMPTNGKLIRRELTEAERLFGFIDFWTEVKYNFAFFNNVPDVNWDNVLLEFLPKISKQQSTTDYYKLLLEVCAKLNDGHTNVYLPRDLLEEKYYPKIELHKIQNKIYVVNCSKKFGEKLMPGYQILSVNGIAVEKYLETELFPYISASTPFIKTNMALYELMKIPKDKTLSLECLMPSGKSTFLVLTEEEDTTDWVNQEQGQTLFNFKNLGQKTAYIELNSFSTEMIVNEFLSIKDSLKNYKKLIIDLRKNGGGNSSYGYEILQYLSPKPFLTSKWMTREHKASFKAWGEDINDVPNDSFDLECFQTNKGDYWYRASPDTIKPFIDKRIDIPVVILIGNNTASAAEDFLIAAENAGFIETVGDYTYGSTGQPMTMRLPGGGSARICTKKDTYPDGREFVGFGIKPKHLVLPTITDVIANKDVVLEFAIKL